MEYNVLNMGNCWNTSRILVNEKSTFLKVLFYYIKFIYYKLYIPPTEFKQTKNIDVLLSPVVKLLVRTKIHPTLPNTSRPCPRQTPAVKLTIFH